MEKFEWDPQKAQTNERAHQVSFEEATTAFDDDFFLVFPDVRHSTSEQRFLLLGRSNTRRVLVVSYTERGKAIRLISAREADAEERETYEEEISDYFE